MVMVPQLIADMVLLQMMGMVLLQQPKHPLTHMALLPNTELQQMMGMVLHQQKQHQPIHMVPPQPNMHQHLVRVDQKIILETAIATATTAMVADFSNDEAANNNNNDVAVISKDNNNDRDRDDDS